MRSNDNNIVAKSTMSIIKENEFRLKKKFGQNFLIDSNILDKIVDASNVCEKDLVIEIGPGIGALSERLVKRCDHLILIEIDDTLIPILEENFSEFDNVTIIHKDVLKVDIDKLISNYEYDKVRVVANLPYYITTPIVMKLLEECKKIDSITIMVQKEVAQRFIAKAGSKEYGAISLAVDYYTESKIALNVSPNCFIPKPKVDSSVLHMNVKKNIDESIDKNLLFRIIRLAFNQRRKTLINSLVSGNSHIDKAKLKSILSKLGFDENIRGEKLSLNNYIDIVKEMKNE